MLVFDHHSVYKHFRIPFIFKALNLYTFIFFRYITLKCFKYICEEWGELWKFINILTIYQKYSPPEDYKFYEMDIFFSFFIDYNIQIENIMKI